LTAAGSTVVTVRHRKAESDAVSAISPEGGRRGYEQQNQTDEPKTTGPRTAVYESFRSRVNSSIVTVVSSPSSRERISTSL